MARPTDSIKRNFRQQLQRVNIPFAVLLFGVAFAFGACESQGNVLPANFNSHKSTGLISIAPNIAIEGAAATVRPLNGIQGSPLAVVAGDADLNVRYWGRPGGECGSCGPCEDPSDCPGLEICEGGTCRPPDGAHITMVRVGTDTDCALSLERVFPDPDADPNDVKSYNFNALDRHMTAIQGLNTADIIWQAAFRPGGQCAYGADGTQLGGPLPNLDAAQRWSTIAINTLKHLRLAPNGAPFDPENGQNFRIRYAEFFDDPIGRGGVTSDAEMEVLFQAYSIFAKSVDTWFNSATAEDEEPRVKVGGLSFTLSSPDELGFTSDADKHPLLRFIDAAATRVAPLHFVSIRTKTAYPYEVAQIARRVRQYLDTQASSAAFRETEIIIVELAIDWSAPALVGSGVTADPMRKSAFIAAFHAAARIYLQDVPAAHAIAGRGPRVREDLIAGVGEPAATVIESIFFEGDGSVLPAFMGFFPFRQVAGHTRVQVTSGPDTAGLAVLASRASNSSDVLHVIIANANVQCPIAGEDCSNAYTIYDLELTDFVPVSVKSIEYKLSVLDHTTRSTDAFFFSDTGILETFAVDGNARVRLTRQMGVPSIHYIEFRKTQ